jgi:hypothetical protein
VIGNAAARVTGNHRFSAQRRAVHDRGRGQIEMMQDAAAKVAFGNPGIAAGIKSDSAEEGVVTALEGRPGYRELGKACRHRRIVVGSLGRTNPGQG